METNHAVHYEHSLSRSLQLATNKRYLIVATKNHFIIAHFLLRISKCDFTAA